MIIRKEELINIYGGASLSGTLLNSIIKGVNAFLDLGRSFGSALRRIFSNNICPL